MIDLKFLRENPEAVKQNIRNKFQDHKLPLVDEVIALDADARKTQQEADELKEKLYGFTQIYKRDETLLNIIKEEAAPYFAGKKTAKDVAGIIQSRVQIYVNENR